MKKVELNELETSMVVGGDFWTDQGYTLVGHSQYFNTNEEAMAFAQQNAEALRKQYGAHSFAWLVQSADGKFYVNYYTRAY